MFAAYQSRVCTESIASFADNPWFASLPQADADALLGAATPLRLAQGEFVFSLGDQVKRQGGAFFGLTRGLLKMQMLHPDGKEAILAVIEPGNWVGDVAILDQLPRAHTAVALVDSELLAVSADRFMALMQRSDFAQAIARMLAGRLRDADRRVRGASGDWCGRTGRRPESTTRCFEAPRRASS